MGTNGTTYLGIDGGGTRCRSRIEDENGRVLGEASSGPATTRICLDKAWRSIMEATEAAAAEVGLAREDFARIHAGIGLAALGRRGAQAALNEVSHPFASVRRGIDRLSLVGGLADATTPSLTPDLRARVRRPDADAAARALLMARGRLDLPKRETT
jgi:N-acetylglucosamine kinase-like BadF-type ATPase